MTDMHGRLEMIREAAEKVRRQREGTNEDEPVGTWGEVENDDE